MRRLCDVMVRRKDAEQAELLIQGEPAAAKLSQAEAEARRVALEAAYEEQYDEPSGCEVYRFVVRLRGVRSLNAAGMLFSQAVSPQVALPNDPVLLEQQDRREQAGMPWSLEIQAVGSPSRRSRQ